MTSVLQCQQNQHLGRYLSLFRWFCVFLFALLLKKLLKSRILDPQSNHKIAKFQNLKLYRMSLFKSFHQSFQRTSLRFPSRSLLISLLSEETQ
ncbi:hypothetical protein C1752_10563 [Acaryochloris thomasi RCC1774]|uniref:Uncharacterized protein n=1 Tax=Acaryochloris thomasi RCC1774 TaxID=1764569 RepID=A0A2W1J8V3_9CYAN|nr:hypothetical protein C1752_10563 [Acaryochloris thomasi RCC1774]